MKLAVAAAVQNRKAIFGDAQHPRAEAFGFGGGAASHRRPANIYSYTYTKRCKKMQICLTLYYYNAKISNAY